MVHCFGSFLSCTHNFVAPIYLKKRFPFLVFNLWPYFRLFSTCPDVMWLKLVKPNYMFFRSWPYHELITMQVTSFWYVERFMSNMMCNDDNCRIIRATQVGSRMWLIRALLLYLILDIFLLIFFYKILVKLFVLWNIHDLLNITDNDVWGFLSSDGDIYKKIMVTRKDVKMSKFILFKHTLFRTCHI